MPPIGLYRQRAIQDVNYSSDVYAGQLLWVNGQTLSRARESLVEDQFVRQHRQGIDVCCRIPG
jgi:hypothetical protein